MITVRREEINQTLIVNDELIEQLTGHDLSFISEASYEGVIAIHNTPEYEKLTFDERWAIVEKTVKEYLRKFKNKN